MNPNNPDPNNPNNPSNPPSGQADLTSLPSDQTETSTPPQDTAWPQTQTPPQAEPVSSPSQSWIPTPPPNFDAPSEIFQPPPPPLTPEPVFTPLPPSPIDTPITPTPPLTPTEPSPLDNPWGAPSQPPAIDHNLTTPQQPSISIEDLYRPTSDQTPQTPQPEMAPPEMAPTDLSQLAADKTFADLSPVYTPPLSQPETLVVPSTSSNEAVVTNLPTSEGGGIPKWIIGVGISLLVLVAGLSGYFILGLGQKSQEEQPTSLPATGQQPLTTPTKVTPLPQPTHPPSSPSSFGQLDGGSNPPPATSAADLLRQRQGR